MVHAGIAPRNELQFFRQILHLKSSSQRGLVKIGYITILFWHG